MPQLPLVCQSPKIFANCPNFFPTAGASLFREVRVCVIFGFGFGRQTVYMALLLVDRNGGESTAGDTSRLLPTPFLTKTYQLVDDRDIDDVISWNVDGSTFIVWNTAEFARDLLPSFSNTAISRVLFANSILTDLGRLCRIDGSSRMNASEEARKTLVRHSATQNRDADRSADSSCAATDGVYVRFRRRAGNFILHFSVRHLQVQRLHGGADWGEQAAEERKRAAQQRVEPHEEFMQQHFRIGGGGNEREIIRCADMCETGRENEGTPAEDGVDLQLQLPVGEIKCEP
ncbi:hypothetical protein DH2020_044559 [Rehmannia glutinosa]|uniref:HSF-type DNA-binding domain-containing protein n=1 Tax=Rehmannia glutinosa TaxID=99300 RepID=A0ABR0UI66_REHGL